MKTEIPQRETRACLVAQLFRKKKKKKKLALHHGKEHKEFYGRKHASKQTIVMTKKSAFCYRIPLNMQGESIDHVTNTALN
jgi:hypothetical protein